MKNFIVLFFLLYAFINADGQIINPIHYEYAIESIELDSKDGNSLANSYRSWLNGILIKRGAAGYELIQITEFTYITVDFGGNAFNKKQFIASFKKANSLREEELAELVKTLNTRIETSTRAFADSSIHAINIQVLNYLKQLPNDVLAAEFKTQLTDQITVSVRREYDALIADLRNRILRLEQP